MILDSGKLNILIDGQFRSTGKGLLASYIACTNHIDIAVSNASANAGHTFYYHGDKHIVKQLPVTVVIRDRCLIYLCAGAIIHPPTLLAEIAKFNIFRYINR
jgi:adenylosuccinate synthase